MVSECTEGASSGYAGQLRQAVEDGLELVDALLVGAEVAIGQRRLRLVVQPLRLARPGRRRPRATARATLPATRPATADGSGSSTGGGSASPSSWRRPSSTVSAKATRSWSTMITRTNSGKGAPSAWRKIGSTYRRPSSPIGSTSRLPRMIDEPDRLQTPNCAAIASFWSIRASICAGPWVEVSVGKRNAMRSPYVARIHARGDPGDHVRAALGHHRLDEDELGGVLAGDPHRHVVRLHRLARPRRDVLRNRPAVVLVVVGRRAAIGRRQVVEPVRLVLGGEQVLGVAQVGHELLGHRRRRLEQAGEDARVGGDDRLVGVA